MKIEKIKISYSTTIPIMSYGVNDKIGVEIELSPESGQFDLEHIVSEHKSNVDAIVKRLYPNMYGETYDKESFKAFANAVQPLDSREISQSSPHEERRIGDTGLTEESLRSCTQLMTLEKVYFPMIDKLKDEEEKRELWLIYDEVYAKLSNQTK